MRHGPEGPLAGTGGRADGCRHPLVHRWPELAQPSFATTAASWAGVTKPRVTLFR
jgi:hypothetical protein